MWGYGLVHRRWTISPKHVGPGNKLNSKYIVFEICVSMWLYYKIIQMYSKLGNVLCESKDFLPLGQTGLSSGEDQLSVLNPDKSCGNYIQEEDRIAIGHMPTACWYHTRI
jgi:hypothetical protein